MKNETSGRGPKIRGGRKRKVNHKTKNEITSERRDGSQSRMKAKKYGNKTYFSKNNSAKLIFVIFEEYPLCQ